MKFDVLCSGERGIEFLAISSIWTDLLRNDALDADIPALLTAHGLSEKLKIAFDSEKYNGFIFMWFAP